MNVGMNNNALVVISLAAMMVLGVVIIAPSPNAYAHNFSGDESASFLAKVRKLSVETHLIQQNLSNKTLVAWHIDKIGEFWNANDTKEMNERNKRLGTDIPALISNITTAANSTNPDAQKIGQFVLMLDNNLAEAVPARIDQVARNNATVGALAIANVLDETIEDYGIAWGAEEEESGSMNVTMTMSSNTSSETNTSATNNETAAPTNIVNVAAYQTAQGLTAAAQNMFSDLKTMAPSNSTASITKLDQGFADLKNAIDNKASNDEVTALVHGTIMSDLQTAFNLQVVPEFPLPLLAAIMGIFIVVGYSRVKIWKRQ
jgi:hypothetical protein